MVILDDATSEIYYAQLVEEESTRTVMAGLREVIERKGCSARCTAIAAAISFVTPKAGEKVDKYRLTQVGRALKELGMQMIPAYSPQARGRCERNFGTWQGRSAARVAAGRHQPRSRKPICFCGSGISRSSTRSFRVPAKEKGTALQRSGRSDLDWIFTVQTDRVVVRDNTVAFRDQCWQIEKTSWQPQFGRMQRSPFTSIWTAESRCATTHVVASYEPMEDYWRIN